MHPRTGGRRSGADTSRQAWAVLPPQAALAPGREPRSTSRPARTRPRATWGPWWPRAAASWPSRRRRLGLVGVLVAGLAHGGARLLRGSVRHSPGSGAGSRPLLIHGRQHRRTYGSRIDPCPPKPSDACRRQSCAPYGPSDLLPELVAAGVGAELPRGPVPDPGHRSRWRTTDRLWVTSTTDPAAVVRRGRGRARPAVGVVDAARTRRAARGRGVSGRRRAGTWPPSIACSAAAGPTTRPGCGPRRPGSAEERPARRPASSTSWPGGRPGPGRRGGCGERSAVDDPDSPVQPGRLPAAGVLDRRLAQRATPGPPRALGRPGVLGGERQQRARRPLAEPHRRRRPADDRPLGVRRGPALRRARAGRPAARRAGGRADDRPASSGRDRRRGGPAGRGAGSATRWSCATPRGARHRPAQPGPGPPAAGRRRASTLPDTRSWRLEPLRDLHPVVDALLAWRKAERIDDDVRLRLAGPPGRRGRPPARASGRPATAPPGG